MPDEIELKLALGPQGPGQLRRHPLIAALSVHRQWLANTYFDTPDGDLEASRMALRIRETPEGRLQTLKTAGKGSGGLHSRGEWEWPIEGEGLDLSGLRQRAPEQLDEATLARLSARFTTDFVRESWQYVDDETHIEIALDLGKVLAAGREVAIHELELELKRGKPQALWHLAERLAERVAMRPANASKAQRGAALLENAWELPTPADDIPARHWDTLILALDAWHDSGKAHWHATAMDELQRLQRDVGAEPALGASLDALGKALARAQGSADNGWLTPELAGHWLRLMQAFTPA
ncbi:CYTH domain-containing protein [Halomonas sp. WWR20]